MFKHLLKSISYHLDLFKRPFMLKVLSKDQESTYFGFFLSLIIFIAIAFSFSQSDMIQKLNPNVIDKTIAVDLSPQQHIGTTGVFVFGVVDVNRQGFIDESMLRIDVTSYTNQGGVNVYVKSYTPVKCDTKWNLNLVGFDVTKYLCLPPSADNYTIIGDQDQPLYQPLSFVLRVCNNMTDGIICKGEAEITNYIKDKFFFLMFPDYSYDVDLYEEPYYYVPKTKFLALNFDNSHWLNLKMKKSVFRSEDSFLFQNYKETVLSELDTTQQITFPILPGTLLAYNNFLSPLSCFYFTSSNDVHYLSRRYQKLQEVLANIAGLANTLIVIGFILTNFQLKFSRMVKVINNLYVPMPKDKKLKSIEKDLQSNLNISQQSIVQTINPSKDVIIETEIELKECKTKSNPKNDYDDLQSEIKINPKNDKNIDNNDNISVENEKNIKKSHKDATILTKIVQRHLINDNEMQILKNETNRTFDKESKENQKNKDNLNNLKNYLQKRQNQHHFQFNAFHYIKATIKRAMKQKLTENQKIIIKAEEIFEKETDIVNIMRKLQEIDKLKYLLLSSEQISLFNLLDKPIIHCEADLDENDLIRLSNLIMKKNETTEKNEKDAEIIQNYKLLSQAQIKSEADNKLLKLLEEQIVVF